MGHPTPTETQTGTPPPRRNREEQQPPSKSKGWVWLAVLVALGGAANYYWPKIQQYFSGPAPAPTTGKGKGKGGGTALVVAARAKRGNIGVYDTGLGAVTPIYTVTIKSRVDGQLMSVNFKEGQMVNKGDLLLEIDPRPYQVQLDQAQGQQARDQALLRNARVDLDRYKTLLNQQAIPEQQYVTQEALVSQYEGVLKTDQAAVDSARLNLTYSRITAPIDGRIGLRLVDPGNIVHASDQNGLLVITQMDPISVIFTIAEDQLPPVLERFHGGAAMRVEAWDREKKNKLGEGKLDTIDNQIDPTTGTLRLRAMFENKAGKLYPSQFVNVRLLVEQKSGVVLVPNAAIQRNQQNTYVWLVKPDSTVTVRQVTTGVTENDQTEILSGLEAGDEMVTVGVDRLLEGGRVNAQVPGEAPRGGGRGEQAAGGDAPAADKSAGKSGADKTGGDSSSSDHKGRGKGGRSGRGRS
ncbi:MAG TPA: MdtA/MuxA family multidrug efflux RND transporter periplasmic adaptor subunit [Bryobacteraceae bacterium]|nr:MdtA/MuxA family multidrug efflux RND transporter periplasmic adaptor subunit [Bryobacteraceae bacterium]